jgi:ABC-type transporter Mla subunit MlaD
MAEVTIHIPDRALKVALVLLGAIFLSWATIHLLSSGTLRPKYQVRVFVPNADGIGVGSSVTLDGIPVGSISSVQPAGNSTDSRRRIALVLRIQKRFQSMIRGDSTAFLVTDGLLGGSHLNIQRGFTGPPIDAGGEIRAAPVRELTLADFTDAVKKIADCRNGEKNSPQDKLPIGTTESQRSR